jgi:hypothetical protein
MYWQSLQVCDKKGNPVEENNDYVVCTVNEIFTNRLGKGVVQTGRSFLRDLSEWIVRLAGNAKVTQQPGLDPSIRRHNRIGEIADEAVLNNVHKKKKSKKIHFQVLLHASPPLYTAGFWTGYAKTT